MSLKLPSTADKIKVIVKADSALIYDEKTYQDYLQTLDESLLSFKPGEEPTRFVLRKVLKYDQAQRVQNSQTKLVDGKVELQMSFMMEEVRQALVGVENPEMVPLHDRIEFKLDNDGAASRELVAGLSAIGAVADLYAARNPKTKVDTEELKKS